jgi:hypothetical protein
MKCDDVDRALSEDLRLPLQAQEHVKSCTRCQQLVSALNMPGALDTPSAATLRSIADGIGTHLSPVRLIAPARYLFIAFIGIFVFIVALGVYYMGAFAIAAMTPLQTAAILGALAVSTGLLAYSLVRQMVPGSLHRIPPRMLPVSITILLGIAIAILFQFQHELDFWANGWACIRAGTPFGVLAAVPIWLLLRRGMLLAPSVTGAATGLFAGLVGASVLEIHCPNLNAWHILVAHLGVAILCTLAGLMSGLTIEMVGKRSVHRSS